MPKLPSYQDVGNVSPTTMRDPGVSAPKQAFESPLGMAAAEFAPVFREIQKTERAVFVANTETRTRSGVKEIYAQNFDNPEGLKNELDKYYQSEEKTMKQVAPNLVPDFRNKFSVWTQPFFSRSMTNYKTKVSKNVELSGADLEAQAIADINDQAI